MNIFDFLVFIRIVAPFTPVLSSMKIGLMARSNPNAISVSDAGNFKRHDRKSRLLK